MKLETIEILKKKGKFDLYTEEKYDLVKSVMNYGMTKDAWLKNYLSLDPLNKAQWCADQLVSLVEKGAI